VDVNVVIAVSVLSNAIPKHCIALSVCLCLCMSMCLSVCQSACLSVSLSIRLSTLTTSCLPFWIHAILKR
jgi:hypothetical protein